MMSNRVKDWMTPNPLTVSSDCTLYEAYRLMIERKIRRLLVVDQRVLTGVVTMEDLRRKMPDNIIDVDIDPHRTKALLRKTTVGEVMATAPKTICVDATLMQAAQLMLENNISTLPVMNGDRLVGIITESDIFKALVKVIVIQQ
jgi:CBS domain-containing protein